MIQKTRRKIIIVTMAILVAVFIAVGAVAFTIMVNKPHAYRIDDFQEGTIIIRVNPEFENAMKVVERQLAREWLLWYALVASTGLAGLFVVVYYLSGWIVRPIQETMEKQKRFVSDASHELKTPISIISANADVLAANEGNNKWLQNIASQTERMRILTNDLLMLTRIDETAGEGLQAVNISEIITSVLLPFESVVFEAGKKLESAITEGIYTAGAAAEITKAAGILIDNAVKYSGDGGTIRVTLTKHGEKVILEVHSTGAGIAESERVKIFDRFYRSDFSRARDTGGNGLGLAILKSLADKRGWKLSVNSDGTAFAAFVIQF